MNSNLYEKDFPNNLKIARRKVINEPAMVEILKTLKKIEKAKNTQNKYLIKYLNNSKKIGTN